MFPSKRRGVSISVLLEEPELQGGGKDLGLNHRTGHWGPPERPHLSPTLARSLLGLIHPFNYKAVALTWEFCLMSGERLAGDSSDSQQILRKAWEAPATACKSSRRQCGVWGWGLGKGR